MVHPEITSMVSQDNTKEAVELLPAHLVHIVSDKSGGSVINTRRSYIGDRDHENVDRGLAAGISHSKIVDGVILEDMQDKVSYNERNALSDAVTNEVQHGFANVDEGSPRSSTKQALNGLLYRARNKVSSDGQRINRVGYNSISFYSASRFAMIMKHLEAKDWKMDTNRKTISGEDVALVVSPHHHLVDDAWRSVRAFATGRHLKAGREKLTDLEKNNLVPKYKRKVAFLVVVANSKATLKKVMAAERTRLGFVGLEDQSSGLVLGGAPLSPSPHSIRFSADDPDPGPPPTNTIGECSPRTNVRRAQNSSNYAGINSSQDGIRLQADINAASSQSSQPLESGKRKISYIAGAPTDRITRGHHKISSMDTQA